jgi:hypothetical protein
MKNYIFKLKINEIFADNFGVLMDADQEYPSNIFLRIL